MKITNKEMEEFVDKATAEIGAKHPTFGGEQKAFNNPIARAHEGGPLIFALGVDVRQVVMDTVIKTLKMIKDRCNDSE